MNKIELTEVFEKVSKLTGRTVVVSINTDSVVSMRTAIIAGCRKTDELFYLLDKSQDILVSVKISKVRSCREYDDELGHCFMISTVSADITISDKETMKNLNNMQ